MAGIDNAYAQWLMAASLWQAQEQVAVRERWGETSIVSERVTGIASAADALAEAQGQLTFLGHGPFAIDVHQLLSTDWMQHLASVVTLEIDQLGYNDGLNVFVLEVEADHASGISTIAVLRPMGAE